jgi:hypothetical protein
VAAAPAEDPLEPPANLFVLSNVYAHVQDFLALPGFARLLKGPLGKGLELKSTPAEMRASLAKTAQYWPTELAFGMPDAGFQDLDVLARSVILAALCHGATSVGASARADLARLQKELVANLRKARLPPLRMWADFPDERVARLVSTVLIGGLRALADGNKLRMTLEGEAEGIRVRIGDVSTPAELKASLVSEGVLSGPKDPQAKAIVAAMAGIVLEGWIQTRGTRVWLAVGARSGTGSGVNGPLLPARSPGDLIYARWETAPYRALVDGWRGFWSRWSATAAGRKLRESDTTDLLGSLDLVSRALERGGRRGFARVWTDRGIHAVTVKDGMPPPPSLARDPVVAVLPRDAIVVAADGTTDLGDRMSTALQQLEQRLAMGSLKEVLGGEKKGKAREDAYYKNGAQLRALVHREGPSVFEGGSAIVVGAGGRLQRVTIREQGKPERTAKDLGVPEVALVGRAKDADAAVRFVGEAWSALAGSVIAAAGGHVAAPSASPPEAPPPVPGASARWLDVGWLEEVSHTSFSGEGDFKLHVARLDSTIVISTSPRLTRQMLAAASGPPSGRAAPPAAAGALVAWARTSCAPIAKSVVTAGTTLEAMFGPVRTGKRGRPFTDELGAIGSLCQLVDGLALTTTQEGERETQSFELTSPAALFLPAPTPSTPGPARKPPGR